MIKTDMQLKKDVEQELSWDPKIDATQIGVSVDKGAVTLLGTVDTYATKWAAEEATKRVSGVRTVAQDLTVKLIREHKHSDFEVARATRNALAWDVFVPAAVIAKVQQGAVTLEGEVTWNYQRDSAERAIRNLAGVLSVYNHITLTPASAPAEVEEKVQAALLSQATADMGGNRKDQEHQLLAASRRPFGRPGGPATPDSQDASDVEPPDSEAVRVPARSGAVRAGGPAVYGLDFKQSLRAFPSIFGEEADDITEISGLSVIGSQGMPTLLVAGIWGCTTLSDCADGGDDACVHSLLDAPDPLGLMTEPHLEADGSRAIATASRAAVVGALARVKTAPLACPGTDPSCALTLSPPQLRASATVVVLGVGELGSLAVQVLGASTASRLVTLDTAALLRLAADHDGSPDGAASHPRAVHGLMQATSGLAERSRFDIADRLANAIVANYGALVAAGRGTGSFLVDGGAEHARHRHPR